jgi:hypothetical protein
MVTNVSLGINNLEATQNNISASLQQFGSDRTGGLQPNTDSTRFGDFNTLSDSTSSSDEPSLDGFGQATPEQQEMRAKMREEMMQKRMMMREMKTQMMQDKMTMNMQMKSQVRQNKMAMKMDMKTQMMQTKMTMKMDMKNKKMQDKMTMKMEMKSQMKQTMQDAKMVSKEQKMAEQTRNMMQRMQERPNFIATGLQTRA